MLSWAASSGTPHRLRASPEPRTKARLRPLSDAFFTGTATTCPAPGAATTSTPSWSRSAPPSAASKPGTATNARRVGNGIGNRIDDRRQSSNDIYPDTTPSGLCLCLEEQKENLRAMRLDGGNGHGSRHGCRPSRRRGSSRSVPYAWSTQPIFRLDRPYAAAARWGAGMLGAAATPCVPSPWCCESSCVRHLIRTQT